MENLQHRDSTPLTPIPKLDRGTKNSVISPVAVQPTMVLGPKIDPVTQLVEKIRVESGLPGKVFSADTAVNSSGLQAALETYRLQREAILKDYAAKRKPT